MTPVQHAALVSTAIQPGAGGKDIGVRSSEVQARAWPLLHSLGRLSVYAIPLVACTGCCWLHLCLIAHCSWHMASSRLALYSTQGPWHVGPLDQAVTRTSLSSLRWLSVASLSVSPLLSWWSLHPCAHPSDLSAQVTAIARVKDGVPRGASASRSRRPPVPNGRALNHSASAPAPRAAQGHADTHDWGALARWVPVTGHMFAGAWRAQYNGRSVLGQPDLRSLGRLLNGSM